VNLERRDRSTSFEFEVKKQVMNNLGRVLQRRAVRVVGRTQGSKVWRTRENGTLAVSLMHPPEVVMIEDDTDVRLNASHQSY
jgi:hypothetical protein